jgi:hypothetical protein
MNRSRLEKEEEPSHSSAGVTRIDEGVVHLLMQVKWSLEMVTDAEHNIMRVIVYRQFLPLKSHEITVL